MDDLNFWKILRVLTTNTCNYKCSFCHNEGQERNTEKSIFLQFEDYKVIIDSLANSTLKEVHFSGGEPFMNSETLKMILYTNNTTDFELGCATNTTFLTEETIKQLASTRIKLNIQFPAIENKEFSSITKSGNLYKVLKQIDLLRKYKIEFGLNHVLQSNRQNSIESLVDFISKNNLSIKLLPDLNSINYTLIKETIFPFFDAIANKKVDKGTGAIKWWINGDNNANISVMYIDSPCFYNDIRTCRNYSEIRLLPNLKLQNCIKRNEFIDFGFDICKENKHLIIDKFQNSWNNFTNC